MGHEDQIVAGTVVIDHRLLLKTAAAICDGQLRISLSDTARDRCRLAHARLQKAISDNRHIYGITTGFGPLANRLIGPQDGARLQQNLVHHLASGVGQSFDWATARAIMLSRLMSILQGFSGASETSIDALLCVLNSDLAPVIPCRGTVGASGDLTPLAHMVLCLQGRGDFQDRHGEILPGERALKGLRLAPLDLVSRDGLALVNGTSAMTGVAVLNAQAASRAIAWSLSLTAALAEVLGARVECWEAAFADVRPHPGQIAATDRLHHCIAGSLRTDPVPIAARILTNQTGVVEEVPGQEAYTLRCAPQVIGAVHDLAAWHDQIAQTELCAVTDNPIFPPEGAAPTLHGGNFMGQHVALASDALATGVVVLAGLAERQIARLTDERLNGGLPAFLHMGAAGLNSGLMGAQVTATALVAEMRATGPASAHSISTNGANQDVVSMGTASARLLRDKLDRLGEVQAILAIAVAQAMDLRGDSGFSDAARRLHHMVRGHSRVITQDRPLGGDITVLAKAITATSPP